MLERVTYNVVCQLTEDILGTVPMARDVYAQHVQSKAEKEIRREAKRGIPLTSGDEATPEAVAERMAEEQATVTDLADDENRGWTTFQRDEEGAFLYDYAVRGFLHEAARALGTWGALKQLQMKFKRYVFVFPRKIRLVEVSGQLERPLRAETPKGPRVTVVRSDTVTAGTQLRYQLVVLAGSGITQNCLADVLSYGEFLGMGQWRSAGWGRFTVLELTPQAPAASPPNGKAAKRGSKQ